MQYFNKQILSAESLGGSVTSDPIQIEQYLGFAIQVEMTGSPNGTLSLQASCDPPQTPLGVQPPPSTFVEVGGTSVAIAAAANVIYNMSNVYYNWVRVVYTRSSGSGEITATFNAKGY